jgi:uncharacterized repeat protein (TIGR03803 family)
MGTETILHSFNTNGTDGITPAGAVVMDESGNLYGTTYPGGTYNLGTVFELTPSGTETFSGVSGMGKMGPNPRRHLPWTGRGISKAQPTMAALTGPAQCLS